MSQGNRKQMKDGVKTFLDGATAELDEAITTAQTELQRAFEKAKKDPRVKRATRNAKRTAVRIGLSLVEKFGTQREKAKARSTRKQRS